MKAIFPRALLLAAFTLPFCQNALAGVVVNGTRVIYPAQAREVTVQVDNVGDSPALVQAWIDSGDANQTADNSDRSLVSTAYIKMVNGDYGAILSLVAAENPGAAFKLFRLLYEDVINAL